MRPVSPRTKLRRRQEIEKFRTPSKTRDKIVFESSFFYFSIFFKKIFLRFSLINKDYVVTMYFYEDIRETKMENLIVVKSNLRLRGREEREKESFIILFEYRVCMN